MSAMLLLDCCETRKFQKERLDEHVHVAGSTCLQFKLPRERARRAASGSLPPIVAGVAANGPIQSEVTTNRYLPETRRRFGTRSKRPTWFRTDSNCAQNRS